MEYKIKKRLKKGWVPTKNQSLYIKEFILPNFDRECGHCMLNLMLYVGLDPWK